MTQRSPDRAPSDSALVDWLEGWVDRLRGRPRLDRRRGAGAELRAAPRIDLIGERPAAMAPNNPAAAPNAVAASAEASPSGLASDAGSNPFQPSAPPASQGRTAAQAPVGGDWQFSQPVLLRQQKRTSSVLVWSLVGGSTAALIWACVAPLGETIAVQGKLQPGSRVKVVQAPVGGVIETVLVRDGQSVVPGQELIRYDLREARNKLAAADGVIQRLRNENQVYAAALGDRAASDLTPNQKLQLRNQTNELISRREVALQALRQSEERLRGLKESYAVAADIARRFADLVEAGAASEVQRLQYSDAAETLRNKIAEEERQRSGLKAQLVSAEAAPGAELRGRIEDNLKQISTLESESSQAKLQLQYGQIKARSAGVVFDLDVSRGSVVEPTRPLLKLVPGDALEARVYVPSKVIGFLHPGQRADLSLDTFPASEYGRLPATLLRIGSDALNPEEMKTTLGADASGLHYPAILKLGRQSLQAGNRRIPLKAGMSLTADIQLRKRTFIGLVTGMFADRRRELERLR